MLLQEQEYQDDEFEDDYKDDDFVDDIEEVNVGEWVDEPDEQEESTVLENLALECRRELEKSPEQVSAESASIDDDEGTMSSSMLALWDVRDVGMWRC